MFSIQPGILALMLTGWCSILTALLFRIGWSFRVAEIEVVSSSGRKARRTRLALRAMLVWLPFVFTTIFVFATVLIDPRLPFRLGKALRFLVRLRPPVDPTATALAVTLVALVVFGIVALITALRNPRRGLVDRIAGTLLVPR